MIEITDVVKVAEMRNWKIVMIVMICLISLMIVAWFTVSIPPGTIQP